jgi:hypothetical protein
LLNLNIPLFKFAPNNVDVNKFDITHLSLARDIKEKCIMRSVFSAIIGLSFCSSTASAGLTKDFLPGKYRCSRAELQIPDGNSSRVSLAGNELSCGRVKELEVGVRQTNCNLGGKRTGAKHLVLKRSDRGLTIEVHGELLRMFGNQLDEFIEVPCSAP